MHGKTEKVKEQRAIRVAMDLVKKMENENTFLLVTKLLGSKEAIKIAAAIESNVKYDLNLPPFYAVMHKLDAEGKKLLDDYDNRLDDQIYWREISAFYLGYATALRLGKTRRHPQFDPWR